MKVKLFIVLNVFFTLCAADTALWFDGPCGISKYPDAGEMPLEEPPQLKRESIVGGKEARPHEFPWQVLLLKNGKRWCGGSIINERWILTAAHCLGSYDGEGVQCDTEQPQFYQVAIGAHNLIDGIPSNLLMDISEIIVHEKYYAGGGTTLDHYDVALLKLSEMIEFSENIQPICAPDSDETYAFATSVVSGWGDTSFRGKHSDVLLFVTLVVTTRQFCREKFQKLTAYNITYNITEDVTCAIDALGGETRDSCQEDSGGPLAVKLPGGSFSVIGIVSAGIGCAEGYPGVYANVGHVTEWVTEKINKNPEQAC